MSELKTHKFARKPFYVDAARVNEANMELVAEWCDGEIKTEDGRKYIEVKVYRPMTDRQTMAFVGDWVLSAGSGFKVYNSGAFDKAFEKVKTLTKEQADAAGIRVPHEKRPPKKKPVPRPPANPVLPESVRDTLFPETQKGNDEPIDLTRVAEVMSDPTPSAVSRVMSDPLVSMKQKGTDNTMTVNAEVTDAAAEVNVDPDTVTVTSTGTVIDEEGGVVAEDLPVKQADADALIEEVRRTPLASDES